MRSHLLKGALVGLAFTMCMRPIPARADGPADTGATASPAPNAATAVDPVKVQHIRKLLELTGAGKLGIQAASQILDTFRKQMPNVPLEFWDSVQKEFRADDLVDMIVPIYAAHFTDDDIQQMIAFYESPVGKKFSAAQADILKESMAAGSAWGKSIAQKVLGQLREKGYLNQQ